MKKLFNKVVTELKKTFKIRRSLFVIVAYYALFYALNLYIIKLLGITDTGNIYIFTLWTFGFTSIFMFISFLFKRKARKAILCGFFVFTIILGAVNIAYYANYGTISSITSLTLLQNADGAGGAIKSVIIDSKALRLFYFLPFFIVVMVFDKIEKENLKRKLVTILISIVFFFVGSLAFFKPAASEWDKFQSDYYLLDTLFMREDALLTFGMYGYHIADIVNFVDEKIAIKFSNNDDIDQYFEEKEVDTATNEATGAFEGKNLVMIQIEALSPMAINPYSTPNLQYMKDNGVYFENFYQSTYMGNTSDAEFSSQTGMMPNLEQATVYTNSSNYMPGTLPKLFEEAGYNTYGSHCNDGEFYNRVNNFPTLYGFENSYFLEELDVHEEGYYYQPDTVCLDKFYEEVDTSEPFYMFFVSVSSHASYVAADQTWTDQYYDEVDSIPGSENFSEEMRVYMAKVAQFDEALGNLVEDLKADGEYEDTVFIMYGDHRPAMSYGIYGTETDPAITHEIPLIIYTPGMTPDVNETLGAEYDIAPTVANLFNLDPNHEYTKYYYGVDLYSENDSKVVHSNREYIYHGDMTHEEIMTEIEIYQKILTVDYFSTME